MSERASEPDIEPRRFNVAEVPEADLPLRSFDFTRLGSTERNAEMRVLFGRLIPRASSTPRANAIIALPGDGVLIIGFQVG